MRPNLLRHAASLALAATGLVLAAGCSGSAEEDAEASGGAATVNVSAAKVALCDKDEGGCPVCAAKIGDRVLTDEERQACTLESLRGGLRDRINFLVAEAGRHGIFLRTGTERQSPVRLKRIKVIPAVGGQENARTQYTKLTGSFTVGEDPDLEAGVSVYSVYMPVRVAFEFEDSTGRRIRTEPFIMQNTYNLIPFFYLKADLAVNLNIGGILSKFGGGPVASTLLSALGANASLKIDASHELKWTSPVCSDIATDSRGAQQSSYRAFDNDFFRNVLLPMCEQYKRDNRANVNCTLDEGAVQDTQTLLERTSDLASRQIIAVEGCATTEEPWIGANVHKVDFVAPERWGFTSGQEAYLYMRNATVRDVWKRESDAQIIGVDKSRCGSRALTEGEVCVHARVKEAFFDSTCTAANAPGDRMLGISQNDAKDTDQTIQFQLPAN